MVVRDECVPLPIRTLTADPLTQRSRQLEQLFLCNANRVIRLPHVVASRVERARRPSRSSEREEAVPHAHVVAHMHGWARTGTEVRPCPSLCAHSHRGADYRRLRENEDNEECKMAACYWHHRPPMHWQNIFRFCCVREITLTIACFMGDGSEESQRPKRCPRYF